MEITGAGPGRPRSRWAHGERHPRIGFEANGATPRRRARLARVGSANVARSRAGATVGRPTDLFGHSGSRHAAIARGPQPHVAGRSHDATATTGGPALPRQAGEGRGAASSPVAPR